MAKASIQEMASAIVEKYGIPQKEAERFVIMAFDVINDGLRDDKAVKVKGLGTFKVIDVRDRESVNVNTGERVLIEGHGKITFTPDTVMRDLVNKPFAQFDTVIINDGVDIKDFDTVATEDVDPEEVDAEDLQRNQSRSQDLSLTEESELVETTDDVTTVVEHTDGEALREPDDKNPDDIDAIHEKEELNASNTGYENLEDETVTIPLRGIDIPEKTPVPDLDESVEDKMNDERVEEPFIDENDDDAENTQDESTERHIPSNSTRRNLFFIFIVFLLCISFLSLGYYWGRYHSTPDVVVKYVKELKPKPVYSDTTSGKSANGKKEDTVFADNKKDTLNHIKGSDTSNDRQTAQVATDKKENSKSDKDGFTSQSLKNAAAIVRSGAYRIIGTDRVITVKKGDTLEKISKLYLGSGMECYIQVYNNTDAVKEGMRLKIPKLQIKKKK